VGLDVKNAFGSASRRILLQELLRLIHEGKHALIPVLRRLVMMFRAGLSINFQPSVGGAPLSVPINEGLYQGWPHATPLYCIVHNWARVRILRDLPPVIRQRLVSADFADDSHSVIKMGLAAEVKIFIDVSRKYFSQCTEDLSVDKTVIYRPIIDDQEHGNLCALSDELKLKTVYRDRADHERGSIACGAVMGSSAFVDAKLQKLLDKALGVLDKIVALIDSREVADTGRQAVERTRQAAVLVIRLCIQSRLAFWKRVQPPSSLEPFARQLDSRTYAAIKHILFIRHQDLTLVRGTTAEDDAKRERLLRLLLELPPSMGGAGFQPNSGVAAPIAFLASFAQSASRVRTLAGPVVLAPSPPAAADDIVPLNSFANPFLPEAINTALAAAASVKLLFPSAASVDTAILAIERPISEDESPNKLTESLTKECNEANFNFVLGHGSPSAYHRLLILEKKSTASTAFITVSPRPGNGTTLTDDEFISAFRHHLGLHPLPPPLGNRTPVHCAACLLGSRSRPVWFDEVHVMACPEISHTPEHDRVQAAIHNTITEAARAAAQGDIAVEVHPTYAAIPGLTVLSPAARAEKARSPPWNFSRNPPKPAVEGDLSFRARPNLDAVYPNTLLIDVTVSSPDTTWAQMRHDAPTMATVKADHATSVAEKLKHASFHTTLNISEGSRITFLPFGIGTSGVLGGDAERVLDIISNAIDKLGAADTTRFSTKQALRERVSVALHAGVADRIRRAVHRQRTLAPQLALRLAQAGVAGAAVAAPGVVGAQQPGLAAAVAALGGSPGALA